MEEYTVKLKKLDDDTYCDIVVTEDDNGEVIKFRLEKDSKVFVGEDEDYLTAFRKLRDALLSAGYGMCCAGALVNALQSGMMAGSDRVYLVKLGEKPSMKNAVGIFDPAGADIFPDSKAQEIYAERFFDSI
ncbi:hypothetical protein [Ruminococcus albus]|uniref:Uncharacterized protein n=1 Tax=Ruminococcus albus TaxID=1264 RepID=A0A1I1I834_RUMAL|nr:hypothetical protein [Ruminococcus albus]SFC29380.1 hypothetical protein SAMN02910406_01464 [Ruminococcus albus]